jgi:Family of unknown function (DUF6264)
VNGSVPDENAGVYTMPPEAYRVGTRPAASPRDPAPAPAARRPQPARVRKAWDVALSSVLLVLLAAAATLGSTAAVFLALAGASCGRGGRVCQGAVRDAGVWTALTTPWMVFVLCLAATVALLVARRRGYWVPLLGLLLAAALWGTGAVLVWAAI